MAYTIKQISEIVDGIVVQPQDKPIKYFITDSRTVHHYKDSLFIALKGPNHDGHKYISDLLKRGLSSFLVDETFDYSIVETSVGIIQVSDTLSAFQKLASYHRNSFSGEVIAITGSNGKTVVKEWLAQLLARSFSVAKSPKSYNSQVGVPVSVMMMNPGPDFHILEAGISYPGEMEKLEELLSPDIGILTNIGEPHQENFISTGEKLQEKLKLFKNVKDLFINVDNSIVVNGVRDFFEGKEAKIICWGYSEGADLNVEIVSRGVGKTRVSGLFRSQKYELNIPFTDSASLENIISIWLFWLYRGYDLNSFQNGINQLEPIAMRLEQKEGQRGCYLINDYYNADLHSLSIAIDLLINQLPQDKKTLIVSDLLQTGLEEDELVSRINLLLKNKRFHRIIGIGPLFVSNISSFDFEIEAFSDTDIFLDQFQLTRFSDEAILLKGARKFRFEKISRRLEKKFHNTFVEVNMVNLLYNLNVYRSGLPDGCRIMAMVKAASYGSGTHEVAKFLANQRIDYLGVAFIDEGVQLREAGIDIPIMVMNPGLENLDTMIDNHLEPEIYSFKILKEFYKAALLAGEKNYPVHIKIDTGMHRLGFHTDEIEEFASFIESQDILGIRSIFSHLSTADNRDKGEFTHRQARILSKAVSRIKESVGEGFIIHLLNSAGIINFPEYHFDMVRLGIGLYGVDPSKKIDLKPVISLKSTITQIHNLKKGETIGYGNSGLMKTDGKVAVIPVGYADGFDRRMGMGVGRVFCNGKTAPVVGSVCMDMTMIDITDIEVTVGDQVTLIGDEISLEEISEKINTIPYEILTRIPQRVRRIYLFE